MATDFVAVATDFVALCFWGSDGNNADLPIIMDVTKDHQKHTERASRTDTVGRIQPTSPPASAQAEDSKVHQALVKAGLVTGIATIAGNAGSDLGGNLLRNFTAADLPEPEYVRLPAPRKRCLITGLARTTLCELIERKEIRAIKVRKPGAQRGIVLINRRSLIAFFHRMEVEQCGETMKGGE